MPKLHTVTGPTARLAALAVCLLGAAMLGFQRGASSTDAGGPAHEEINVQRINVLDEGGNLAVVIAAPPHLPGVIRDGEQAGMRDNLPGMLFYNNQGDEVGGMLFPTTVGEDGRIDGGVSLTFDQIPHSQTVQLIQWQNDDFVRSALRIQEFPTDIDPEEIRGAPEAQEALGALREAETEEEAARLYRDYLRVMGEHRYFAERVYLGSEGREDRIAMLELKDSRSRPRIRLIVDENDEPRIEMLDAAGEVTWSMTGAKAVGMGGE